MIIRPAFRVELKMHVRRADGSREVVWLPINESFDGQTADERSLETREEPVHAAGTLARRQLFGDPHFNQSSIFVTSAGAS